MFIGRAYGIDPVNGGMSTLPMAAAFSSSPKKLKRELGKRPGVLLVKVEPLKKELEEAVHSNNLVL